MLQLHGVVTILGIVASALVIYYAQRTHTTAAAARDSRNRDLRAAFLDDDETVHEPTILSDPPASVPSTTTLVEATRATAEPRSPLKEPTHTDTTGPPVPVREWESSVVYKGYVFNMKRVCVRRNRVLFLRKTWPYPEEAKRRMGWMFIDSFPDGIPSTGVPKSDLLELSAVTVYTEPTVFIAGASTGPNANPTHTLFNIFGSFSIGMEAGNAAGAPYTQAFYHVPGMQSARPETLWDAAFGQEIGLLSRNATILTQPSKVTTACFENLIGSRRSQEIQERTKNNGQWFRQLSNGLRQNRPPAAAGCEMVIMDRTDMPTRQWSNAAPFVEQLRARYPAAKIHYFNADNPFTALSPHDQFTLFSNASVFIGPQGGVEGNLIFMRPRSLILTMCCNFVSWAHGHHVFQSHEHEWHVWSDTIRDDHDGFKPGRDYLMKIGNKTGHTHRRTVNNTLHCHDWSDDVPEHLQLHLKRSFAVTSLDDLVEVVDSISSGPCARQ